MKKKAFIFIFLILICLPYPVWAAVSSLLDQTNYEKRELAEVPDLKTTALSDYTEGLELYINDRLPFRNELLTGYSTLDLALFRSTTADRRVVLGKEDWLFYHEEEAEDPIRQYLGQGVPDEEMLEQIAENLTRIRDGLAAEGKEFIIFIAPNKERIYSEYMPAYYGAPAEEYPVSRIVSYLQAHTDLTVVYPYEEIMQAKAAFAGRYPLYYKTDTHWNAIGAYVGTRELLRSMGVDLPGLDSPEIAIGEKKAVPGDLSDLLHIGTGIEPGPAYTLTGYSDRITENQGGEDFSYVCEGADPRKLFMVRDSFCIDMAPVIGTQFAKSDMIHIQWFDPADPRLKEADIVVLETVEREAVPRLSTFRLFAG